MTQADRVRLLALQHIKQQGYAYVRALAATSGMRDDQVYDALRLDSRVKRIKDERRISGRRRYIYVRSTP